MSDTPRLRNPGRCPKCHAGSRVINSRLAVMARIRRRACRVCPHRWTTYESLIDPTAVRFRSADSR